MEILRYGQQKKASATNGIPSPSPRPTASLFVPVLGLGLAVCVEVVWDVDDTVAVEKVVAGDPTRT
jgi:hypothetical protein